MQALRENRRTYRGAAGDATITAGAAAPSGALVIEAKNISKSYGDRAIVSDFSIRIQRGDRIGIVGPNGTGKTTLINMLTGVSEPDSGTVRLGSTLAVATLNQHRDSLDPNVTVKDALTGGDGDTVMVNGQPKHVIGYMKDFLFSAEQARTPLGKLSGGERGRLMLAQALAKPSNLLVLDEPTNDLDMETLDVLEDMLGDYPGTVLLISHDRDFLDRLVSGVIVPEGDGRWTEYAGGYSDMLAQRGADLVREGKAIAPKAEKAPAAAQAAGRQAQARLQGKARAGDAAENHRHVEQEGGGSAGQTGGSAVLYPRPRRLRKGHHGSGRDPAQDRFGRGAVAGAGNPARRARELVSSAVIRHPEVRPRPLKPGEPRRATAPRPSPSFEARPAGEHLRMTPRGAFRCRRVRA